jgi:hypothetical protein|tara:strand:- start:260 stop:664 length:405 start_codon:yes stop_codon:yes gene_type:complete
MATINTTGIASGSLIFPEHVLRSIEALNGTAGPFDISLSGSLVISGSRGITGLKISSGSVLENVTPQRYLAYNTSSGDVYMTTGSVGFSVVHLNDVAGNGLPQEGVSAGAIAVTGSNLAFYNGSQWKRVITGSF